eukprot:2265144-Rhodomonas_salina.4
MASVAVAGSSFPSFYNLTGGIPGNIVQQAQSCAQCGHGTPLTMNCPQLTSTAGSGSGGGSASSSVRNALSSMNVTTIPTGSVLTSAQRGRATRGGFSEGEKDTQRVVKREI